MSRKGRYFNPHIGCEVRKGLIEKALEGDRNSLDRAFGWDGSNQGDDFWDKEYINLSSDLEDGLSLKAYIILAKALAYEKGWEDAYNEAN